MNRFLDVRVQGPGIANTRRAAVTDQIESEFIEIFLQTGFLKIIRNNARPRCE